jgi:hypothetical protein
MAVRHGPIAAWFCAYPPGSEPIADGPKPTSAVALSVVYPWKLRCSVPKRAAIARVSSGRAKWSRPTAT